MRVLILLAAAVFLGCSNHDPAKATYDKWSDPKGNKWQDASLILSNISGKDADTAQVIISNLCRGGRVKHSSHEIWINAYVETKREKLENESQDHQELRQQVSDLQNRVYELENE